jgi:hypothetical protein
MNDEKQTEVDISSYPTGLYFLKVIFKDGEVVIKTIVKE